MTAPVPAIIDTDSGLFTEAFLLATLRTRVATARRAMKQLGLVTIAVTPPEGGAGGPSAAAVGEIIRDTLRDSDTGVLLDDGCYVLLLEFTPVDGCTIIANRLSDRIGAAYPGARTTIGVANYPVHAMDATELLQASQRALAGTEDPGADALAVAPVAD